MCSPNDDMTNPALADRCLFTTTGWIHTAECDHRNAPAGVWCCECTEPSVIVVGGLPFCQPHSVLPLELERRAAVYG